MSPNEDEAWKLLIGLDPKETGPRCGVVYETVPGHFLVNSFGCRITVSLSERLLSGEDHVGTILLEDLGTYSRIAILWYLIGCKDIPVENRLVNPSTLPGGDIFLRGTHVLPLERLANRFSSDIPNLFEIGKKLGGKRIELADASIQLFPLPKIPVHLLFWEGDEEFSANASILFDTTCQLHLPIDIIWAVAMMSIEMMLRVV